MGVGRSIAELVLPDTLVDLNTVFIFTAKERCSVGSFSHVPCCAPVTLEAERGHLAISCLVYSLVIFSHLDCLGYCSPRNLRSSFHRFAE